MRAWFVLGGLGLLAFPAQAADQPAPPTTLTAAPPAADAKSDDLDKITCKREVVTGSRIASVKVCSSERGRQELARGWRKWMDDMPSPTSAQ